jgi:hypothetical protein
MTNRGQNSFEDESPSGYQPITWKPWFIRLSLVIGALTFGAGCIFWISGRSAEGTRLLVLGALLGLMGLYDLRRVRRHGSPTEDHKGQSAPLAYMAVLGGGLLLLAVFLAFQVDHAVRQSESIARIILISATSATTGLLAVTIFVAAIMASRRSRREGES